MLNTIKCKSPSKFFNSRFVFITISCLLSYSLIGLAQNQEERLYLRYQGQIEGTGELEYSSIECLFEILNQRDESLHRERHQNVIVNDRRFTVTLGERDSALYTELFLAPTKLATQCDLDRNGTYDIFTTEAIGNTPKAAVAMSVKGTVDADYIRVNGNEVVSPDGEWLGSVVTDQDLQAQNVISSSITANEQLTASTATITDLSSSSLNTDTLLIQSLSHKGSLPEDAPTTLVNDSGAWVGPIVFQDQDQDGVVDWIEVLLGTDPSLAESYPQDENEDGIFDLLQPTSAEQDLELDFDQNSFSNSFTFRQGAEEYVAESNLGEPWTAASIEVVRTESMEDVTINVRLQHPNGVHLLSGLLILPNDEQVQLFNYDAEFIPEQIQTEKTYSFNEDNPPLGIDWFSLAYFADQSSRSLEGNWTISLTNHDLEATGGVTEFSLQARYKSENELAVQRDLDFGASYKISGLVDPTSDLDAVNKVYVDNRLATTNEALQRLDPSYPSQMAYRYRVFETYDVESDSFYFAEHPELFGGISSSDWSLTGVTASQVNVDLLANLLNQQSKAGSNALIVNQAYLHNNANQGLFALLHTQIENVTEETITFPLEALISCGNTAVEAYQPSSFALNGVDVFTTENQDCNTLTVNLNIQLELPANQVSDLVFLVASSTPNPQNQRRLMLAFINDHLGNLPQGLIYRKLW